MGAVAEDDVEQQHRRRRIGGVLDDPLAADGAVDHRMRASEREDVVAEVDDAMPGAVTAHTRRDLGQPCAQQGDRLPG